MNIDERYASAKEMYAAVGVDTDKAIELLDRIPVSMHCWQGDDLVGFEGKASLSGGIQTTGNYPGKAFGPEQLMADLDKAFSLIPGKHRLNLHAIYAIFEDGETADRDALEPKHFKKWVEYAKQRDLGLDFNPSFFSHPLSEKATLSSEDESIRKFWVRHGIACLKIAEYFATELVKPCSINYWIPDGFKDIPADRTAPRARLKKSLDEILATPYDKEKVIVTVESKVFGIGFESYTVGSHEFYMNYAAKNDILCLLDNGHFHPTEQVADKISSMLLFSDKVALHVSRPVRWDSDHVVLLNDDTKEIAKEIVNCGPERVILALDFFDASINRISAWVVGMRNMQKALLLALLTPNDYMKKLQNERRFTELMALGEELKMYPAGDVWNFYCKKHGVPAKDDWIKEMLDYEKKVLEERK